MTIDDAQQRVARQRAGFDVSDAGHLNTDCLGRSGDFCGTVGRRREQKLIVVAARQRTQSLHGRRLSRHSHAARYRVGIDHRIDTGAFEHVGEVAQQPVGQVDRTAGNAPQGDPKGHAGLGQLHRPTHGFELSRVER